MCNEDTVGELVETTRRLRARFAGTAPRQWDAATAGAELTIQVGHLALCLLRRRGLDVASLEDPERPITDVGNELADIVLSGVSVPVLLGSPLTAAPPGGVLPAGEEVDVFLRLLVTAGSLTEAGMVEAGYRHHPTGFAPDAAVAGGQFLAACELLSRRFGLELVAEFRAMAADADRFLDRAFGEGTTGKPGRSA